MLLVIQASTYSPTAIHLSSAVKNNIIENSLFTRLFYSTKSFTTNGLFLKNFTQSQIKQIETNLLKLYDSEKEPTLSACEQTQTTTNSVLKISGIWENETKFGLAYKFIHSF